MEKSKAVQKDLMDTVCYSFLSLYLTAISTFLSAIFPPIHLAMNSLDLFVYLFIEEFGQFVTIRGKSPQQSKPD